MREADIIRTIGEQGEGDILNRQIGKFCLNIWVIDARTTAFSLGHLDECKLQGREPAGRDYQLAGALP